MYQLKQCLKQLLCFEFIVKQGGRGAQTALVWLFCYYEPSRYNMNSIRAVFVRRFR